ncbi:MAG: primosomal replication protein N [Rhodocyclaceae bacterium]|nr:primosomal replication protein N [Rhodocyclaceae bacterium]
MTENRVQLDAEVAERIPLRVTPAGVPIVECLLAHRSRQVEGGSEREVGCEIWAVAVGDLARIAATAAPGARVRVEGFLAARSLKRRSPVLHLNKIEFFEGNPNGL